MSKTAQGQKKTLTRNLLQGQNCHYQSSKHNVKCLIHVDVCLSDVGSAWVIFVPDHTAGHSPFILTINSQQNISTAKWGLGIG